MTWDRHEHVAGSYHLEESTSLYLNLNQKYTKNKRHTQKNCLNKKNQIHTIDYNLKTDSIKPWQRVSVKDWKAK